MSLLLSLALSVLSFAGGRQTLTHPTAVVRPSGPFDAMQATGGLMPKLKSPELPAYPAGVAAAGVAGVLNLELVVGTKGEVRHVRIATPLDERLDASAVDTVFRWKLEPARGFDGHPVTVLVDAQLTFSLSGGKPRVTVTLGELAQEPLPAPGPQASSPVALTGRQPGMQDPKILRRVEPRYTSEAMRAKIMGTVSLEISIRADGTVGSARVRKSLDPDHGLDRQALIAARYWLFEPATLNGQPVPTTVVLELEFKLH